MAFEPAERRFVAAARIGRLATADGRGRPTCVPICFAFAGEDIVSAIDEKPSRVEPTALRRVRDVLANPAVTLLVDRYTERWDELGWVQVRGRARLVDPGSDGHREAVTSLREKYDQYAEHDLPSRPVIGIEPTRVVSWGDLDTLPG